MGIRGLGGFIKWKLPHARKSLQWSNHAGAHWGIDCSCLLYRARGSGLNPLTVMASLLTRMRRNGIQATVIFDGRPPTTKADVVDQRRVARQAIHKEMADIQTELTGTAMSELEKADMERRHAILQKKAPVVSGGDKDELKQFLYACGVQFITAAGEADDVLAYLCRNGILQGVVSTDMDMLARGVPLLVIPETVDTSVLTAIQLDTVLVGLDLKYPQFVDACMLMGCDYSGKDWKSVEPKEAVILAKKGVNVEGQGSSLLRGEGVTWEVIVSEKQRAKWSVGPPPCEPENVDLAARTYQWPADWIPILSKRG